MIKNKKIFITGGAGFFGVHFIKNLIDNNKITIYDNLHRNSFKYTEYKDHPNLTFIQGNILDIEKLRDAIADNTIIIHLAAIAGVSNYEKMPFTTMEVNAIGTYNIISICKTKNIECFVDFATSEIYGPSVWRAKEDECTSTGPSSQARWSYSVSKLAGEHMSMSANKQFGFPAVSLRPFNVFGPYQTGEGGVQAMSLKALKNEEIKVYGDGNQIRAWVYIDDLVDATLLAIENKKAYGQCFNIGNPLNTVTIYYLAKMIKEISRSRSKITIVNNKFVDIDLRTPTIEKAQKVLGFSPKYELEEGLEKTIEWYRNNLNELIV